MSESVGRFHRWSLHRERAQYLSILLQRSAAGQPCYVTDADFTDGARITRKMIQRLAQLNLSGVEGADAWKIVGEGANNNFLLKGGNNTDDGMVGAWIGGLRATLYQDVDYKCERLGAFSSVLADQIHHRYSSIAAGQLVDQHAKWTPHVFLGLGLKVQVGGLGLFTITDNTATVLTLGDGFDPTGLEPHLYYYFHLGAVAADTDQTVWLDAHIEDWGMAEDPRLNHNPTGTAVECARRERLITRVWVQQVAAGEQPTVDYTDSRGARHYLLKRGTLHRVALQEAIDDADVENDGEENASSGDELAAAREFQFVCVEDQPADLAERLTRDQSVITVAASDNATAYRAMFNGPQGLLDALACDAAGPRTVFLRNGTYAMTTLDAHKLVVRAGWTLVGESPSTFITLHGTGADDECLLVEARGRISNLTVLRDAGGSANVCCRLGGRGAQADRVYFRDLRAGTGTTVLVQSDAKSTTGAGLVDCEIYRPNGGIGIRFAGLHDEPAVAGPQGGVPPGTTTSIVDTSSISNSDEASSFGAHAVRTRVHVIDTTYSRARPAIFVGAGDGVLISDCTVQAQGCPGLVVATGLAGGEVLSTWNSRGATVISGTTVLIQPSAAYAVAASRGVSFVSGRVLVEDLRVEALDTGSLPTSLLAVDATAAELLDLLVHGVHVRAGACTSAVALLLPPTSSSRVVVHDLEVTPASSISGPTTGIRALHDGTRGVLQVHGGKVTGWSVLVEGMSIEGNVLVDDVTVDGTDCIAASLVNGAPPSGPTSAFKITAGASSGIDPTLTRCISVAHSCIGFWATGGYAEQRAMFRDCKVQGAGRTLVGFYTDRAAQMSLVGCEAADTLGAGASDATMSAVLRVYGGKFSNPGLAYNGGDPNSAFPTEGVAFNAAWAACVAYVGRAERVETSGGAAGVMPSTDGVCVDCETINSLAGLLIRSERVVVNGHVANDCTEGVVVENINDGPLLRGIIARDPLTTGVRLLGVNTVDLECDVRLRRKASRGISMVGVSTDGGNWRLSARVDGPESHDGAPVVVASCGPGSVEGLRVRMLRGPAVQFTSLTEGFTISDVDLDCGYAGQSSLVISDCISPKVLRAELRYGVTLSNCDGAPQVRGAKCYAQGVTVFAPASGKVYLQDVIVDTTPATSECVYSSGIYVGGELGAPINHVYVNLDRCHVYGWQNVNGTIANTSVGQAEGRSAGIRLNIRGSVAEVRARGCVTRGATGIGMLVGDLNTMNDRVVDSVSHWNGVELLYLDNCSFEANGPTGIPAAPPLVAVLRQTPHVISNCYFDRNADIAAYLFADESAAAYSRVDFKGNRSHAADLTAPPFVRQSEYMVLDGGMTQAELAAAIGGVPVYTGLNTAVIRTNSVWFSSDFIAPDGTLP